MLRKITETAHNERPKMAPKFMAFLEIVIITGKNRSNIINTLLYLNKGDFNP